MANKLYDPGREGILDESIKMNSGDIRIMLIRSSYVFLASHKFLADLGAVSNGRSLSLTGKTFAAGIFDANDISLFASAAIESNALVYFQHSGVDASARLICFIDSVEGGFPFIPSAGQQVDIQHSNQPNKIFKL